MKRFIILFLLTFTFAQIEAAFCCSNSFKTVKSSVIEADQTESDSGTLPVTAEPQTHINCQHSHSLVSFTNLNIAKFAPIVQSLQSFEDSQFESNRLSAIWHPPRSL